MASHGVFSSHGNVRKFTAAAVSAYA